MVSIDLNYNIPGFIIIIRVCDERNTIVPRVSGSLSIGVFYPAWYESILNVLVPLD